MTTIADVSDTSFWVAYYRAQETDRPDSLFKDPLAKKLIGERGKHIADSMGSMSRYTAWSVIARTVMIDRFIYNGIKEGVDAVINLGTGLDARPYRMDLPADLEWVEVDYPNIINHKNEVLKNEVPKCKLTRVAVDLADHEKRKNFLANVVPQAKKVMILTEGVIIYLSPEHVTELANDIASQKRFAYWITEHFDKRVYKYLQTTVRKAKMKNAPFKFYPENWFGFFKNLGWVPKDVRYSSDIAIEFNRKQPMPKYAQLLMLVLPEKIREQAGRMAGYVVFKRA